MEKNAKIVLFFYKEQKRTHRSERSFEKNGCPTLAKIKFLKGGFQMLNFFFAFSMTLFPIFSIQIRLCFSILVCNPDRLVYQKQLGE